jgi:EAL domain-containing protein (putative c-di-GMP-specific phosphodiesterase class I)
LARISRASAPEIAAAGESGAGPRVLVVDDEPAIASGHARSLRDVASSVTSFTSGREALQALETRAFDVVVSDIHMPDLEGTELLRAVRARDLDLPVIFVTGAPTLATAQLAVELGAFRYLPKPASREALCRAVVEAVQTRALARTRSGERERAELEGALRGAITGLHMAYQPIVICATRTTFAFEALMRSREPALPTPPAVLDAAEKLGAIHAVGRQVRRLVAADLDAAASGPQFFVNLHSADLADTDLYDPHAPLSRHARRVVLELTERSSLEAISDLDGKREQLRQLGYRVAVDDLGAGYAGLSYFARIRPELVKIDMSLVRGIDGDGVKQKIFASLVRLATGLGMEVVAEGVETIAERDAVVRLGATYVQGYGLAKPGPPFPTADWR